METLIHQLNKLAEQKAQEYLQHDDLVALTITGSLARGMIWEGSDLDLWGFTQDGEDAFADGTVNDIYWEIDLKPVAWLQQQNNPAQWLYPPRLEQDEITPVEAFWGCRIVVDRHGALTEIKAAIDMCVQDQDWLRRRANHYLIYGRGCIDALQYVEPLQAIVTAREAATRYGVAAYWMRRGMLFSSGMRVPERLNEHPDIQALYCAIFGLGGKAAIDEFLANYRLLPERIRQQIQSDIDFEVIPAYRRGVYDGALRYIRENIAGDFEPAEVASVLGLDQDWEAHKKRILDQTNQLFDLIERVTILT